MQINAGQILSAFFCVYLRLILNDPTAEVTFFRKLAGRRGLYATFNERIFVSALIDVPRNEPDDYPCEVSSYESEKPYAAVPKIVQHQYQHAIRQRGTNNKSRLSFSSLPRPLFEPALKSFGLMRTVFLQQAFH